MATTSNSTHDLLLASERQHLDYAASVSPSGHLGHLDTPVYLLHGEADNIIPSAETQWMASELPHHSLKAELISPVLSHLELDGTGPTAWDELRLVPSSRWCCTLPKQDKLHWKLLLSNLVLRQRGEKRG